MTHQARWRALLLLPLALVVVAGLGFVWFLRLTDPGPEPPAQADGIVVLTGGPERIETGLRLLAAGKAGQLLISGLGHGVELPELARRAGLEAAPLAPRVTLGRMATSTHTNATETALWAREKDIRTLIVVTADYHMPRALLELRRAMPGIALHRVPILSGQGGVRAAPWRRLAEEYAKWVLTQLGLSGYSWSNWGRSAAPGHAAATGAPSAPTVGWAA